MSIELFLYLADVIPNVAALGFFVALFGGIASVVGVVAGTVEADKEIRSLGIKGLIACGVLAIFVALVPSKQTMYMMAGATVAKQALNSSIGQKVQQAIEDQLDEFIKKGAKK